MDQHTLWNEELTAQENNVLHAAEQILLSRINRGQLLSDPGAAGQLLRTRLALHKREFFSVIYLDTRHRVIKVSDLFAGTIDGCEVHPREVAREALLLNAVSLIIGHNHPSGNPEPSAADRALTARLKEALKLLDIRLLDHFVVAAGEQPVSFAARGWI